MREIGAAAMPIIPSFDGLKGQLEQGLGRPMQQQGDSAGRKFGDSAGSSLTSSLSKHAKKAALLVSGALAVGAVGAFKYGSDAVSLAADLEQSVGAVDTVFKDSADEIHKWAKGAANDVGLTRNEFNELGSLIGTQLKNGGTAMERLAPKTNKLIKLGADLSSMFGGETSEAVEALSSALKGERDPIERYGVTLNDAAIKAEALQSGLVKSVVDSSELRQATIKLTVAQGKYNEEIRKHGKDSIEATSAEGKLLAATDRFNKVSAGKVEQLTDQQKQTATLSLIYKQTADAQGNFGRESDTLSGKQQRLKASLEDTKTEIGTALLPIVADAADFLLKEGVPAFEKFADWFTDDGIPALRDFGEEVKPLAEQIIPAVGDGLNTIKNALKAAAPLAKDLIGAFNDMPDWAKSGAVLGAVGLGVASKAKGGKGGKGGPLGLLGGERGSSIAKPMYVFVTNGAIGAGPGGKGGAGGGLLAGGAPVALATAAGLYSLWDTSKRINEGEGIRRGGDRDKAQAVMDKRRADLSNPLYYATGAATRQGFAEVFDKLISGESSSEKIAKTAGAWGKVPESMVEAQRRMKLATDGIAGNLGRTAEAIDALNSSVLSPPQGAGKSVDITTTWEKIPEGKLKLLQDPTTVQTRKDVRELLAGVDGLNRKDFKLIFSALGLAKAKNDAQTLLKYMEELTGMTPSGGGTPRGSNGPFRTPEQTGSRLTVDRVIVQANGVDRLIAELNQVGRRAAIGGLP